MTYSQRHFNSFRSNQFEFNDPLYICVYIWARSDEMWWRLFEMVNERSWGDAEDTWGSTSWYYKFQTHCQIYVASGRIKGSKYNALSMPTGYITLYIVLNYTLRGLYTHGYYSLKKYIVKQKEIIVLRRNSIKQETNHSNAHVSLYSRITKRFTTHLHFLSRF